MELMINLVFLNLSFLLVSKTLNRRREGAERIRIKARSGSKFRHKKLVYQSNSVLRNMDFKFEPSQHEPKHRGMRIKARGASGTADFGGI